MRRQTMSDIDTRAWGTAGIIGALMIGLGLWQRRTEREDAP